MRDGYRGAFAKAMARMLALKLAIALVAVAIVAGYGFAAGSAGAQDQESDGYEPILSQGGTEETTESVVGNIADGRDESTTPVEGGGGMEETTSMGQTSMDDPGLSEGSLGQEQTRSEAPLPEASPGPPLTDSTAPGQTTMEPTTSAMGQYEDTTPLPGATPDSGGLSTTALLVGSLLFGSTLIGTALLTRSRTERGEEPTAENEG